MKRGKPDLSRLVTLDYSPTEAAMLVSVLEAYKRASGDLGIPMLDLIDGTTLHIRTQLKQLHWPQGHNVAPYPV